MPNFLYPCNPTTQNAKKWSLVRPYFLGVVAFGGGWSIILSGHNKRLAKKLCLARKDPEKKLQLLPQACEIFNQVVTLSKACCVSHAIVPMKTDQPSPCQQSIWRRNNSWFGQPQLPGQRLDPMGLVRSYFLRKGPTISTCWNSSSGINLLIIS